MSLNYHPGIRQRGYNSPPNEGWTAEEWHQSAIGDTNTSHTLPGRLYIVQCEWCPEAFAALNKSDAMQMFRAHESAMLGHAQGIHPVTAAQFEDAEGRALVEAAHQRKREHTLWCAGNHEGPCRRGRDTGTEAKALELKTFPPIPPCPEQSGWGFARDDWFEDRTAERKLTQKKRLTDPELAAEYYRSAFLHENSLIENDGYDGMPETRAHRNQATALHRFSTLPHYDEVTE